MAELQQESEVRATYDAICDDYARALRATEPEQEPELALVGRFAAGLVPGDASAGSLARPPDSRTLPAPLVLDAGCGTGRLLPHLTRRGCRVTGVDLSPGMLACARRDHPEFSVGVASPTALPCDDAAGMRARGHDVVLHRWHRTADEVSAALGAPTTWSRGCGSCAGP